MAIALDACRGAAERAPPIGADDEAGGDAVPALKRDFDGRFTCVHRSCIIFDAQQRWKLLCTFGERGEKMMILDVVAERIEPDLGSFETNLWRANEALRCVDDPHRAHWRGVVNASGPGSEGVQRGHRARQQGGGAMVRRRSPRDQCGFDAGLGQGNRRCQPGRTATDDRHLDG